MKGDCQFLSANLYARSVFGKSLAISSSLHTMLILYRRGCIGQSEYRERGRQRPDHGLRAHPQPVARVSVEFGEPEGIEQGWRCVSRSGHGPGIIMVLGLLPATSLGSTLKFVVKDITLHQTPGSPRMQLPFLTEMTGRTEVTPHVLPVTQRSSQQAIANKRHNVTNYVREYRQSLQKLRVRGISSLIGQLAEVVPRQSPASGQACRASSFYE